MNHKPLVSVLVPVYKVEKYLDRCVQSLVNQTYKNWELLLVDDGSPDNSGTMCDSWAARDPRIKAFHKPNGGVSSARNLGLDEAKGVYLTFLDSDDWLAEKCLASCVEAMNKYQLDYYQFRFIRVDEEGRMVGGSQSVATEVCDFNEFLMFQSDRLQANVAGNVYRKVIIDQNRIRFNEQIHFGEDQIFQLMVMRNCKRLRASEDEHYYYYLNNCSATAQIKFEKWFPSYMEYCKFLASIPQLRWKYSRDVMGCVSFWCNFTTNKTSIELIRELWISVKNGIDIDEAKKSSRVAHTFIVFSCLGFYPAWYITMAVKCVVKFFERSVNEQA